MTRTFDPFDELAAMFLTAPPRAPEAPDELQTPNPAPPHPFPHSMRETLTPPHHPRAAGLDSTFRPLALDSPRAPEARRAEKPLIELLLTGHLPVRGGLWLTPYADALGRELGTVALLRLDGEEPSLQVLRAPTDLASASLDKPLDQTILLLGATIDLWVIRPPGDARMPDLLAQAPDRITILTSADEAAVVAAYQLIKDLAQAGEAVARPLPAVGLAVVGADSRSAAAVVERLNRTTVSFLGVEIKLAMCLQRVDTGIKSTRYIVFPEQAAVAADRVISSIQRSIAAAEPQRSAGTAIAGRLPAARADIPTDEPVLPSPNRTAAWVPAQPRPQQVAPVPAVPVQVDVGTPPIKLPPKPARRVEPKQAPVAREPDDHGKPVALSTYVQGLVSLPVRAPHHERIELAVDGSGRLHLLGREPNLREMTIVQFWAHAHRELLAMACPQHAIDHSRKPTCHVFTDQPVTLADLHGTELRLHVLAPVVVNGQTGWYAAPLSR